MMFQIAPFRIHLQSPQTREQRAVGKYTNNLNLLRSMGPNDVHLLILKKPYPVLVDRYAILIQR